MSKNSTNPKVKSEPGTNSPRLLTAASFTKPVYSSSQSIADLLNNTKKTTKLPTNTTLLQLTKPETQLDPTSESTSTTPPSTETAITLKQLDGSDDTNQAFLLTDNSQRTDPMDTYMSTMSARNEAFVAGFERLNPNCWYDIVITSNLTYAVNEYALNSTEMDNAQRWVN